MLAITMTNSAIAHVNKLIQKRGSGVGFRLHLETAGCSGLRYKTELIDIVNHNDLCFPACEQFNLYIEPKAYPYLKGTVIDLVTEGVNQVMKYNNPNQTAACGCGESFTIDEKFSDEVA